MDARRSHRLSELAQRFELELQGDPDCLIDGVGTLRNATPSQVSFLANPLYREELAGTRAGAVIISARHANGCPVNALLCEDPYLAYARVAALFDPRPQSAPGVHPTAVIDESARIGRNVSIGAHVVVGAGACIGDGCTIHPGAVVGADCELGEGSLLYANVTLNHGVKLGKRVILHSGAVLGADGFGIAQGGDAEQGKHWEKVPQLGGVRLGDDCEVGANSAIDRGAIDDTVLEEDVRVDNLVQIGHNVHIGAHTAIAGASAIAGSARIGRYCLLAGKTAVNGHVTIADRTTVGAGSNVMRDVTEPGTTLNANLPAQPIRQWQRILSRLLTLESLFQRVLKLERGAKQR